MIQPICNDLDYTDEELYEDAEASERVWHEFVNERSIKEYLNE
jgi:hypothetical protein